MPAEKKSKVKKVFKLLLEMAELYKLTNTRQLLSYLAKMVLKILNLGKTEKLVAYKRTSTLFNIFNVLNTDESPGVRVLPI